MNLNFVNLLHVIPGMFMPITVDNNSSNLVTNRNSIPYLGKIGIETLSCEGKLHKLNCANDEFIDILEAEYGRTDETTCGEYDGPLPCVEPNTLDVVKERCQGKQRCFVPAWAGEFGNPCEGGPNFLRTRHRCLAALLSQPKSLAVTSKEHVQLVCPGGTLVFVTDATYGGWSNDGEVICGENKDALNILQMRCNTRPRCVFDVNDEVLGHSCQAVMKYLELSYQCQDISTSSDGNESGGRTYNITVCESTISTIVCPEGRVLEIVDANFGRSDTTTCPHPLMHDTKCISSNSKQILSERCNDKSECTLIASITQFGNPCEGTHKYLDVSYQCNPETKRKVFCDSSEMTLQCPPGHRLLIKEAMYGRETEELCSEGKTNNTNCSSKDASDIVENFCNYKKDCILKVASSLFEDPCEGTSKYLRVDYSCIPVSEVKSTTQINEKGYKTIMCEGETATVSCPEGQQIAVADSLFGRMDHDICGGGSTIGCETNDSTEILAKLCNDKQLCEIETTIEMFGDPCPDTKNYLMMFYHCLEGPRVEEMKPFTLCEHKEWDIKCPKGSGITIREAFYGRNDTKTCHAPRHMKNTSCTALGATGTLAESCDGKSVCTVSATNDVFGDPCPRTHKYLSVNWGCKEVMRPGMKQTRVCNGKTKLLSCSKNLVIKVAVENMDNYEAAYSLSQKCDGKPVCPVSKSGTICSSENITDYKVIYECTEAVSVPTTEDEYVVTDQTPVLPQMTVLRCPPGESIRIVDATYGVPTEVTEENLITWDPHCLTNHVSDILSAMCDLKSSCVVTISDEQFGSFCEDQTKILSLNYRCQTDNVKKVVVCNGMDLNLDCPPGDSLHIIDAYYGRNNPTVCSDGLETEVPDGCSSSNARTITYETCEGKESCIVSVDEAIFGDPCVNVSKYLEVKYACKGAERKPDPTRNATLFIKDFVKDDTEEYVIQGKKTDEKHWSITLGGGETPLDLSKPQTITSLNPGETYDFRLVKKSQMVCDCPCYPSVKLVTFNEPQNSVGIIKYPGLEN